MQSYVEQTVLLALSRWNTHCHLMMISNNKVMSNINTLNDDRTIFISTCSLSCPGPTYLKKLHVYEKIIIGKKDILRVPIPTN